MSGFTKHKVDDLTDDRIAVLRIRYGDVAVDVYRAVIERIHANGGKIHFDHGSDDEQALCETLGIGHNSLVIYLLAMDDVRLINRDRCGGWIITDKNEGHRTC